MKQTLCESLVWKHKGKVRREQRMGEVDGDAVEEPDRLLPKSGTIVDAALIAAPSTKNATGARDPGMHQANKESYDTGTIRMIRCLDVTIAWTSGRDERYGDQQVGTFVQIRESVFPLVAYG